MGIIARREWREALVFDWAERDEKVARKLSLILEAPAEHKEKIIGKVHELDRSLDR